jgi:hypothetical protein
VISIEEETKRTKRDQEASTRGPRCCSPAGVRIESKKGKGAHSLALESTVLDTGDVFECCTGSGQHVAPSLEGVACLVGGDLSKLPAVSTEAQHPATCPSNSTLPR